jgi:hypothetical protein
MQLIFHQFLSYSMVYGHQFMKFATFPPDLHQSTAVAQLVETLRYKPEGRGFDSRWCHWNFSLT